jgi:hypothetical protein
MDSRELDNQSRAPETGSDYSNPELKGKPSPEQRTQDFVVGEHDNAASIDDSAAPRHSPFAILIIWAVSVM